MGGGGALKFGWVTLLLNCILLYPECIVMYPKCIPSYAAGYVGIRRDTIEVKCILELL